MKLLDLLAVVAATSLCEAWVPQALLLPRRLPAERRGLVVVWKKNSGQKQREMMLQFEKAKREKEQAKRRDEAGEILGETPISLDDSEQESANIMDAWIARDGSPVAVALSAPGPREVERAAGNRAKLEDVAPNGAWRSMGPADTRREAGDADEVQSGGAAPASTKSTGPSGFQSAFELDALISGQQNRAHRTIEYLHRGQLAPLEVWSRLVDPRGHPSPFPKFAARQPVVVAVTHFRKESALLRSCVSELNQRLPRKFPAEVVIVTRDTPARNKRLESKAVRPLTVLGSPEENNSDAEEQGAWLRAYGVTELLLDWGLAVFLIDSSTGELISVSYNCQPHAVPEYIQMAVKKRNSGVGGSS